MSPSSRAFCSLITKTADAPSVYRSCDNPVTSQRLLSKTHQVRGIGSCHTTMGSDERRTQFSHLLRTGYTNAIINLDRRGLAYKQKIVGESTYKQAHESKDQHAKHQSCPNRSATCPIILLGAPPPPPRYTNGVAQGMPMGGGQVMKIYVCNYRYDIFGVWQSAPQ